MKEVFIKSETIKLDQFLKWAGIFSTGGEAKLAIAKGNVKVNGVIETKRSRRLSESDIIELAGHGSMIVRR